jgi:organic radical activating enzyme
MSYSDNKHFCIMPFTHMEIAPRGNSQPCCAFKPEKLFDGKKMFTVPHSDVSKTRVENIFTNHPFWVTSRNLAKTNTINPACQQCHMEEAAGLKSYRINSNEKFLKYIDIDSENNKLLSLELKLGAKCNIACRMCSSQHSNKLLKEDSILVFGEINKNWIRDIQSKSDWATSDEFWKQVYKLSKDLKYIKFTGGEPLVIYEHFKYLNWLADNNLDPEISYITNGTVKLTEEIKDIWKRFSHVHMSLSIDAIEDLEEYIRTGTVWEEKEKNIKDYINFLGVDNVGFTVTVNSLNINSIDKLVHWMHNNFGSRINVVFNILVYPEKYDMRNLSDGAKQHINYKLNTLINTSIGYPNFIINGISNIKNSMNLEREFDFNIADEILNQENVYAKANKKEISFEKIEPEWFNILKEGEKC